MNFDARRYVLVTFIVIIGAIYVIKLFYMQVIDDSWKARATQIAEKRREITPPRAVVFDRNGNKIVSNKTYYNLMMVEAEIKDLDTMKLAKLIGWTREEVRQRFIDIREGEGYYKSPITGKTTSNYQRVRAYPFMKELTADEISHIAPQLDDFPGFYEEVASMRNYPYATGANVLGYLSEATREEIEADQFYRPGSVIGRAGIERFYEEQFRGKKGVHFIVTSALNNAVAPYEDGKYDTAAVQADPVHLGLDVLLQGYGEELMKNKKGCIVAIEPSTGEILALVSSPNYDPNLLVGNRLIKENYPKLVKDENKPLFPRPLASEYPPGSIFKLAQALIGMQEGVIDKDTGFPCTKSLVGCHGHPSAQNISQAVKMSCNPYFYYVTRRIVHQDHFKNDWEDAEWGLNRWAKYMNSFGFGVRLDTDITGLRSGRIPNSAYYDKWYGHHRWQFSTIYSIAIGQGEVTLTPLQMANLAAIMANRGWYYTPHFVKSIGNKGPLPQYLVKHHTMVDPIHFPPVIEGMRGVVEEPGGTARLARTKDIIVCGKTGTAQNPHGKDHSIFIAFAPMNNPKIAIAVFIENAGFGGTWAAPIASLMIEKYIKGKISDPAKEERILKAELSNFI